MIVLLNVLLLCAVVLSPVVFALSAAIHVNDDAGLAVSAMLTVPPLQIVALFELVIVGSALMVRLKPLPLLTHPFPFLTVRVPV